jgi:hypothetical protein
MSDDNDVLDFVRRNPHLEGVAGRTSKSRDARDEPEEASCAAFGYLRGLHERALNIEFRFKNGNREWYPYSLLAGCRYDPSVGILLKFTSEVTTLVLVRGSNLDLPVNQGSVDLMECGLGRHRVLCVREMEGAEVRSGGSREPTVDRIDVAEFESQEELREWLKKTAPCFLRP